MDNIAVPGGFLVCDLQATIQDIDEPLAALLGLPAHRMVGRSLTEWLPGDSQAVLRARMQQVLADHQVHQVMVALRLAEGNLQPACLHLGVNLDLRGQVVGFRGLIQSTVGEQKNQNPVVDSASALAVATQRLQVESAERQRAEAAAAQRAREVSALHSVTTALLSTLDLERLLGQILDAATNALPVAEKGMLYLIARDTGQLEMRAAIGYTDPRIQKVSFPGSKGYVARAVRGRSPLLIRDVMTEPIARFNRSIPEVRAIQSVVVAPLIEKEEVLGAISLESSRRGAFTKDDLQLLVSFAATATMAIHNAQLHAEVQKMAITDALTGLYNRRGFDELGKREMERVRRFGHPLSAMMIDVDHFKRINDTYGHHVGDIAIQGVARRLSDNLREVDVLGRFGGDEFTVLLPETDLFTATTVAERLRSCVADSPMIVEQVSIKLTISLGVTKAFSEMHNLDALIGRADKALYQAKLAGRNRVEVQ